MHKTRGALAFAIAAMNVLVILLGALAWGNAMGNAAASTIKIVAIGASNTAGWGVGSQNAYPAQLHVMLKTRGYNVQVINAGKSFDTTNGMLRRLDAAVPSDVFVVIVQPGGNDLRFFGSKGQRTANIAAITSRLRARNIKVIVFENAVVPSDMYQWDGIHFTTQGHKWVASYILPQVIALINATRARDDLSGHLPASQE
jgi:acyl-CoA thioesterase-1